MASTDAEPRFVPPEVWYNILSFVLPPAVSVFDDCLNLIGCDINLVNLLLVSKAFKSHVETILKTRDTVIRAGQQAHEEENQATKTNNSPAFAQFLHGLSQEDTQQTSNWDINFLQYASHSQRVVIQITHPADLPEACLYGSAWADILIRLALLEDPLVNFLGGQNKTIRVEFMPNMGAHESFPVMTGFPGSPEMHWKFQPVHQALQALSFLSPHVGSNPWAIMDPPTMLVVRPESAAGPLELKQHTISMERALRDAFNLLPHEVGTASTNINSKAVARAYQCFDRRVNVPGAVSIQPTTRIEYDSAYLALHVQHLGPLYNVSNVRVEHNPFAINSQQCTLILTTSPNSSTRTWNANPALRAASARLRHLTPFPRIPELTNLYDSCFNAITLLEDAIATSHARLPESTAYLTDPQHGLLTLANRNIEAFQTLRGQLSTEEYHVDKLGKAYREQVDDVPMAKAQEPADWFDGLESVVDETDIEGMFATDYEEDDDEDTEEGDNRHEMVDDLEAGEKMDEEIRLLAHYEEGEEEVEALEREDMWG